MLAVTGASSNGERQREDKRRKTQPQPLISNLRSKCEKEKEKKATTANIGCDYGLPMSLRSFRIPSTNAKVMKQDEDWRSRRFLAI
jgi:hypothetical protein